MGVFQPQPKIVPIDLADEPEFDLAQLRIKPAERAIFDNGERHELQPRVMQVLIALARARPAVVGRDRLAELCWNGRVIGDDAVNRCILALRQLAEQFTPRPFVIETVARVGHRLVERPMDATQAGPRRLVLAGAASVIALLLAAAVFIGPWTLRPWATSPQPPTVLVAAVANDPASQALARDLAVKLGSLNAAQSASMRLIVEPEARSDRPDLVLKVERIAGPGSIAANLTLTSSNDRAILWSSEFRDASATTGDLEQQIAFGAARVLGCALEGMASGDQLSEQGFKTYLDACAALSDSTYDPSQAVRKLVEVVATSPHFVGGWAKLLAAEVAVVDNPNHPQSAALRPVLARHIEMARELEPNLAEAYIAEAELVSPDDFQRRSRLLDLAVARNPTNAEARDARAYFLQSVGRVNDAVQDARKAVLLDPLSPAMRDDYIAVLGQAGKLEAANKALSDTERLWPGATSLIEARYRLNLRYGDPREALRLLRSDEAVARNAIVHGPFLEARIDRSPQIVEKAVRQGRLTFRNNPKSVTNFAQTLAEFDRKEELLGILLGWRRTDPGESIADVLFRPAFADLHRDPRFMRMADRLGLLKYWRASGKWPDFCFAPDRPYDCRAEAAKIAGGGR